MARISICQTTIISSDTRERFLPLAEPGLARLARAQVSLAGISDAGGEFLVGRERPGFHLVLYTLSGAGVACAGGGELRLRRGSVLLAPAHSSYAYRAATSRWRFAWVHLRRRAAWSMLEDAEAGCRPSSVADDVESAMEGILREAPRRAAGRDRVLSLHAELLLAGLQRELSREESPLRQAQRARLAAVWSIVDAGLAEPWTVAALARLAGMSEGHFHRLCREIEGEAPMRAVARMRLRRAAMLLRETPDKLEAVAMRVGYANVFAFSVAFKRAYGTPPSVWRLQ